MTSCHYLRSILHGSNNVLVAGTTAEIAFQAMLYVVNRRLGVAGQEAEACHDHSGRAVTTLQAVIVPEGLLDRMKLITVGHSFNRGDLVAIGLDGKKGARLDRVPIHKDGACAATGRIATNVCTGEAKCIPNEMDQELPRFDVRPTFLAVDRESDRYRQRCPAFPNK